MLLAGITHWCCRILHNICSLSVSQGYLTPVYKTACFFKTAFCNNSTATDSNIPPPGTSTPSNQVTHYVEHFLESLSNLPRTANVDPPNLHDSGPTKELQSVSGKETTTGLQMLLKDDFCLIDWCVIQDHVNFWLLEVQKKWWNIVQFFNNRDMRFPLGKHIEPPKTEARQVVDCISSNDLKYFAVGCIIGGVVVALCFKNGAKGKSSEENGSSDTPGLDKTAIDALNERVESTINSCRKAEATFLYASKKIGEKIDALANQPPEYEKLEQYVSELESKCKHYQNEAANLSKKLIHTEKGIETELNSQLQNSYKETKRLQKNLDEVQGQLNLSRDLHRNELTRLHHEAAEKNAIINKLTQVIEEQENLIINLRQQQDTLTEEKPSSSNLVAQYDSYVVDALKKIDEVLKNTEELARQVDNFRSSEKDKTYLNLEELLIRNALILDTIESQGHAIIREKRKNVLECIHRHLKSLEDKLRS